MIEIRIHGRGGQGGVTLAKIIATIRFLAGDSVQAFGLYAAERSGAPLQAFCRYDHEPIENRNLIYQPDHVIVLDPTLISPVIGEGLCPDGWILINTPEPPESFAADYPTFRLATVDATTIARDNRLGTRSVPIVNTALAGAVARMLGFELASCHAALEHLGFVSGNLEAASRAFEELCRHGESDLAMKPTPRGERRAPDRPRPRVPGLLSGGGGDLPGIRTGQWATQQPHRQRYVPPCNHICPAGNDVRSFLQALARDETDEALAILLETTPFPAICGRVCPAPCMESCNRIDLDGAVNVRDLERFAGDHGEVRIEPQRRRDEKVSVIGSGPAGLAAAYHLGRLGYRVTVVEGGAEVGGLLRTGIPAYRLPPAVLDHEIDRILGLGVEVETGRRVDRPELLELTRTSDAVLVATGLQELRSLDLGTAGAAAVTQGIDFLDRSHQGTIRVDDEDVVVVGGGNTAMDAARSALRLGAAKVSVIYRRTRNEMPAIREEIDQALEEGVDIDFLTAPISLTPAGDSDGGSLFQLTCRRMELGEPDESGRRRPREIPGSDFDLYCNRVILALGQSPDLSVFPEGTEVRKDGRLLGLLETPVFAVGDLATNDGTVAAAIGNGRRSAFHIHQVFASGGTPEAAAAGVPAAGVPLAGAAMRGGSVEVEHRDVIRADAMKLHLFERQAPSAGASLPPLSRRTTFDEIHRGLTDPAEARRCLSCGVCDECDRCVTYCPEGVLKRVGQEFVFDYAYCKGCGVCAAECPRNVIFMSHL